MLAVRINLLDLPVDVLSIILHERPILSCVCRQFREALPPTTRRIYRNAESEILNVLENQCESLTTLHLNTLTVNLWNSVADGYPNVSCLHFQQHVADAGSACIRINPSILSIGFVRSPTATWFLSSAPELKHYSEQVTRGSVAYLSVVEESLQSLQLSFSVYHVEPFFDSLAEVLPTMRSLQSLKLNCVDAQGAYHGSYNIGSWCERVLFLIAHQLHTLTIDTMKVSEDIMPWFNWDKMQHMRLEATTITPAKLLTLGSCVELRSVHPGMEYPATLHELLRDMPQWSVFAPRYFPSETVEIVTEKHSGVTDLCLAADVFPTYYTAATRYFDNLTGVTLETSIFSVGELKHLVHLKHLTELTIGAAMLDDYTNGIPPILPRLERFTLRGRPRPPAAEFYPLVRCFPNVHSLLLKGFVSFADLRFRGVVYHYLMTLEVGKSTDVNRFDRLSEIAPRLQRLKFNGASEIWETEDLAHYVNGLQKLRNLTSLSMRGVCVRSGPLCSLLQSLCSLHRLKIGCDSIMTGAACEIIARFGHSLQVIKLNCDGYTQNHLQMIAQELQHQSLTELAGVMLEGSPFDNLLPIVHIKRYRDPTQGSNPRCDDEHIFEQWSNGVHVPAVEQRNHLASFTWM